MNKVLVRIFPKVKGLDVPMIFDNAVVQKPSKALMGKIQEAITIAVEKRKQKQRNPALLSRSDSMWSLCENELKRLLTPDKNDFVELPLHVFMQYILYWNRMPFIDSYTVSSEQKYIEGYVDMELSADELKHYDILVFNESSKKWEQLLTTNKHD
jgi:hypothetical protein